MEAFLDILFSDSRILWLSALTFAVPAVVLILGELVERLDRAGSPYSRAFDTLRKVFLPIFTLAMILGPVLGFGPETITQADGTATTTQTTGGLILRLTLTALCFALMFTVLAFVSAIREQEQHPGRWEAGLPSITKTIARAAAILIPIALIATAVWDLDLTRFLAAIGVGSVALAFGLQKTISSIFSGLLLALDKPFKEGDWIELDGYTGKVIDLNWRTTRIAVEGRDVVVIPNTNLLDSSLRNYTVLDPGYRDKISFGFAYDNMPNVVKSIALQVAHDTPGISQTPPPEVHLVGYGDSSVDYEMFFNLERYESPFQASRYREALMTRLFYAASKHGLEIPFPIRTVRRPNQGDLTPEEIAQTAISQMEAHPVLAAGNPDVRQRLASRAEKAFFGAGMPISRIGEYEGGIYLIELGRIGYYDASGTQTGRTKQGDLIGARYVVGRRPNQFETRAETDVEAIFFPYETIEIAMNEDVNLARALHSFADQRLHSLDSKS